jgi:hypothetical protein
MDSILSHGTAATSRAHKYKAVPTSENASRSADFVDLGAEIRCCVDQELRYQSRKGALIISMAGMGVFLLIFLAGVYV